MKKPPPDPKTCASCAFFTPEKRGDDSGECRRYPPVPIVIDGEYICLCPQMGAGDWCGEFARFTH